MYGKAIKYIVKNTFSNPAGKNIGLSVNRTCCFAKLVASVFLVFWFLLFLVFVVTLDRLMIYPFY